jgi:hypothetical protein
MFRPRLIDQHPIKIRSGRFVSRIAASLASEAARRRIAEKHGNPAANPTFP